MFRVRLAVGKGLPPEAVFIQNSNGGCIPSLPVARLSCQTFGNGKVFQWERGARVDPAWTLEFAHNRPFPHRDGGEK